MRRLFLPLAAVLICAGCTSFTEPNGERIKTEMGIDITPISFATDETPDVSYSAEVILARAEGYYREREFEDATREYGRFLDLHATHPWAPFALFRKGMSYVGQVKTTDHDTSLTKKALQSFNNLIANYPDSVAIPEATLQRDLALGWLAEGELRVAQFYIRTHRPDAALGRLHYLMEHYPDSPSADKGWYDMGRAMADSGDVNGALDAYQHYLYDTATDPSDKQRAKAEKAVSELSVP